MVMHSCSCNPVEAHKMKLIIALLLAARAHGFAPAGFSRAAPATARYAEVDEYVKECNAAEFADWKKAFGKTYASPTEEDAAFANFLSNLIVMKRTNAVLNAGKKKMDGLKLSARSDLPFGGAAAPAAAPAGAGAAAARARLTGASLARGRAAEARARARPRPLLELGLGPRTAATSKGVRVEIRR